MTLRTKSKGQQWMVWLYVALVILVVYIALSLVVYGAVGWNPLDYRYHRLMLPLVLLFLFVAHETRWDGVRRVKEKENRRGEGENEENASPLADLRKERERQLDSPLSVPLPAAVASSEPEATAPSLLGEELFEQARAMAHQPIPDYELDEEYLELLGDSVEAGYAPAMAKLGEYAMRRAAWVEAYYWMTSARRHGMHGLSPILREIRQDWAREGFPEQIENESELFPEEAGSIGRALLHIDSGRDAAAAREFLKAYYPEFL